MTLLATSKCIFFKDGRIIPRKYEIFIDFSFNNEITNLENRDFRKEYYNYINGYGLSLIKDAQ